MGAADAGVVLAELFPGEAERVEHVGVADLLEALGAGGGAPAGDGGKGLLETQPGAEVEMFFAVPVGIYGAIVPELRGDLMRRKKFQAVSRCDRSGSGISTEVAEEQPEAPGCDRRGRLFVLASIVDLIVAGEQPENGVGQGRDLGRWGLFCGGKEILGRL